MSQMIQPAGLDSDRIDGRRPWRPVVACLLIGLIIGGLLGGLYGGSKKAFYTATTALSVLPDSIVDTTQTQTTPTVDATSFIQSQLVVLNGSQLANLVQTELNLPAAPSLSSTQVGQSYVVQTSATADSQAQALSIAILTAQTYAKQRATQLTTEINASATSINSQLASVRASLAAAQSTTTAATGLTPSQTALQTEYERLLSVSSALKLALPQVNRVVTVLSPASIAPKSVSATAKYLIGGAVLGALLGLALLILARRTVSRTRTVGDIAGLGVPVLLPVLPRRSIRARRGPAAWRAGAGRLLAGRLAGQGPVPKEPIVVVGATPGVGTSFVAATIASGLAERGPVLLVLASEVLGGPQTRQLAAAPAGQRTRLTAPEPAKVADLIRAAVASEVSGVWFLPCDERYPSLRDAPPSERAAILNGVLARSLAAGWVVVVDAPALSESDLGLDLNSGATTLVIGRGKSRPADVLGATELFESHGSRLLGAILNDVPVGLFSRTSLRSKGSAQPSAPTGPVEESPTESMAVVATPTAPAAANAGRRRAAAATGNRSTQSIADSDDLVPGFGPVPRDSESRS